MNACERCHGRGHIEADAWDLTDPENLLGWVPCPDCRCVPLCAADSAYGKRAAWWKHEPQCPARSGRNPQATAGEVDQ